MKQRKKKGKIAAKNGKKPIIIPPLSDLSMYACACFCVMASELVDAFFVFVLLMSGGFSFHRYLRAFR